MNAKYWWKEPAKKVAQTLCDRRRQYLDYLEESRLWRRIRRNWDMYHAVPHSGWDRGGFGGGEIRLAGEDGEFRIAEINQFRSSIGLLSTYITDLEPEWDALAQNSDSAAYNAAKKANKILDGYTINPDSGVQPALEEAVEHALILSRGYVWPYWDKMLGYDKAADRQRGEIIRTGDFRFLNPSVTDVSYEYYGRTFEDSPWVHVRRLENRYDVAEGPRRKGATKEMIIDADTREEDARYHDFSFNAGIYDDDDSDLTWVDYAYHKETPAMPNGRFIRFMDEGRIVLEDREELPDGFVPVHPLEAGSFLLSSFGYTPAFDCQAPQELLNAVVSTIATNHNALGTRKIWMKYGEQANYAQLEPGVSVLQTPTEPKSIDLLKSNPELFKGVELYQAFIRNMSGANDTAAGDPEPNLKSGAALAFMEQRTQKAVSRLVSNYERLQMSVGTSIIKILKKRAGEDTRTIFGMSQEGRADVTEFSPEELEGIERVAIVRGNPATRSLAGRIQIGEAVLQRDGDPSRFVELVKTGDLDALLEDRDKQLDTIKRENEALMSGQMVHNALATDNHIEHIRRHGALLDDPNVRANGDIVQVILGVMRQHQELMDHPEAQRWQVLLGYADPSAVPMSNENPGQGGTPPEPGGMVPLEKPASGEHMELSGGTPDATGAANDAVAGAMP